MWTWNRTTIYENIPVYKEHLWQTYIRTEACALNSCVANETTVQWKRGRNNHWQKPQRQHVVVGVICPHTSVSEQVQQWGNISTLTIHVNSSITTNWCHTVNTIVSNIL